MIKIEFVPSLPILGVLLEWGSDHTSPRPWYLSNDWKRTAALGPGLGYHHCQLQWSPTGPVWRCLGGLSQRSPATGLLQVFKRMLESQFFVQTCKKKLKKNIFRSSLRFAKWTCENDLRCDLHFCTQILSFQPKTSRAQNVFKIFFFRRTQNNNTHLKFTYTAMHGVGYDVIVKAFKAFNFRPCIPVQQQVIPLAKYPYL